MNSLVAEKLNLHFDISSLRDILLREILPLPPAERSPAVAGWSIQSASGSYLDGWQTSFLPYNGPGNKGPSWFPESPEQEKWQTMQDCDRPTKLCVGPYAEVIREIERLGFHPRRARIIRLKAQHDGQWHQDGSKKHYQVRLHIPIISNKDCFFETEYGSQHLSADGSAYLVHINRLHRVINGGDQDRFHLVMNVWDTKGLSKYHSYSVSSPEESANTFLEKY